MKTKIPTYCVNNPMKYMDPKGYLTDVVIELLPTLIPSLS